MRVDFGAFRKRPCLVAGRPLTRSLVVSALLLAGCAGGDPSPSAPRPLIKVASFDFSENRVLAEVYAGALRQSGYPVQLTQGLGAREIVQPALEQGAVDLVVEYSGTLLRFLTADVVPEDPRAVHAALRAKLSARGVVVGEFGKAEDQNGFAITAERARSTGLRKLSDLVPSSRSLVFGGPPECPERPYCLKGLQERYGLQFRAFRPMPSRSVTAEALKSGEIDVGLLETTDARLDGGRFVLLADDRNLQPPENIVPIVRRQTVDAHGDGMMRVINGVTRQLTTPGLIRLNRRTEIDGITPAEVAAEWLRERPRQTY
jgi:osmoprotectant transport system substrate-binding protein